MERSLFIIKPDGVQRGLMGEIIRRLENRGLRLVAAKFIQISPGLAARHYAVHQGKPFYEGLLSYITSGPVMVMAWEGPGAIAAIRQTMGSTKPTDAAPGSIRHDFGLEIGRNLTHGSDSPESSEKEIALFFRPEELVSWTRETDRWIFEEHLTADV